MTYFLSTDELAATRAKLDKLNARAAKRGWTGRMDISAVKAERSHTNAGGINVTTHGWDVTITGETPKYDGWEFVAAIDATGDSVVVRSAPGATDVPANDTITAGICEHCETKRVRKATFFLRNTDSGETKLVGKTCMKDFLGWDTFPVWIDEDAAERDLFGGFGGSFHPDHDIIDIARIAFAATDLWGYKGSYDPNPTRSAVSSVLHWDKFAADINAELAPLYLSDADVQARIDFVLENLTEREGFEANLRAIVLAEAVSCKHLGIATAIASCYARLTTKKVEAEVKAAEYQSRHMGVIGDKLTVTGTITSALTMDGYHYGTSQRLMVLSVGEGDIIKTFTTAAWSWDAKVGDVVTLTATVKDHSEFNGRHETLVTRAKVAG